MAGLMAHRIVFGCLYCGAEHDLRQFRTTDPWECRNPESCARRVARIGTSIGYRYTPLGRLISPHTRHNHP